MEGRLAAQSGLAIRWWDYLAVSERSPHMRVLLVGQRGGGGLTEFRRIRDGQLLITHTHTHTCTRTQAATDSDTFSIIYRVLTEFLICGFDLSRSGLIRIQRNLSNGVTPSHETRSQTRWTNHWHWIFLQVGEWINWIEYHICNQS